MVPALLLAAGLAILVAGAEALVRGASRLALAAGLSRLAIGLVVVSIGTSAPEIAVSVGAARAGAPDLALGNVVGSNTFNVLFILGVSALVVPLVVQQRLVRLDIPAMVGAGLLVVLLALDGGLGTLDALLLLALAAAYIWMNFRLGRQEAAAEAAPEHEQAKPTRRGLVVAALLVAVGLAALVFGARMSVDAATTLARTFGVSDLVIGLTIVAAGTSLPEVATSVIAAYRGERDIAVGNVVGSNVLNILLILGLAGLVAPDGLPVARGLLTFDLPVMVAVSIAILPVAFTGQTIARWEGALFLGYYAAYVTHLLLRSTDHASADEFGYAFTWFILPLTAIVLGAAVVREIRHRRAA